MLRNGFEAPIRSRAFFYSSRGNISGTLTEMGSCEVALSPLRPLSARAFILQSGELLFRFLNDVYHLYGIKVFSSNKRKMVGSVYSQYAETW